MMDARTLDYVNRKATRESAAHRRVPMPFEECDREHVARQTGEWRMPFIGERTPRGYRRTDREPLFCDHSGFGLEYEPAATVQRLSEWLRSGYYYGVIESGQFQSYVAEFERR